VTTRRCTLGDIKAAFADAALAGKTLITFGTQGYTRDALTWADKARVPMFTIYSQNYQLSANNSLAEEHMPAMT
jgi:hypothetical protein